MYAVIAPFLLALVLSLALVPLCRLLAHARSASSRSRARIAGIAVRSRCSAAWRSASSLFVGAAVFGLVGELPVLLACAVADVR